MVLQDLDILFEDNHLIIANKPCGVLVQGDKTGDIPLLEVIRNYIKNKYDKKGNPILNVSFDYKTKKRRITEKKYNKYNDIVSWTIKVITEKDTTITNISEFKYLYDHKNNPVEVKSFSNGKILYKIRNKFLY